MIGKKIIAVVLILYTLVVTTLLIINSSRLSDAAGLVDDKQVQIDALKLLSFREERNISLFSSKVDSLKTIIDRIDVGIVALKDNREQIVFRYSDRISNLKDLSLDSLKQVALED